MTTTNSTKKAYERQNGDRVTGPCQYIQDTDQDSAGALAGVVAEHHADKSHGGSCDMIIRTEEFDLGNAGSSPLAGTAELFPEDSDILGAKYEITEAIVGGTSFLIGDDAGTPDTDRLWAAQTTYTLGTKAQIPQGAIVGAKFQGASAGNVRFTWTGTATAGKDKVTTFSRRIRS